MVACGTTLLDLLHFSVMPPYQWHSEPNSLVTKAASLDEHQRDLICGCPLEHGSTRVGSAQRAPGSAASCSGSRCLQPHCDPPHGALVLRKSQVTEPVTFLPSLHSPLKCLQLLLMMQEDPLSITSETQKLQNNCVTVAFSTLHCGLVLVCNF